MGGAIIIAAITFAAVMIKTYETKTIVIERTVLIAMLSAIGAAGRVLFVALPNVQPASFIVIVSGMCFGKGIGMMTGIVMTLASNFVLGHGPWTVWQMIAWGAMGLLSGAAGKVLTNCKPLRVAYGFVWGFVFGWFMNAWFLVGQEVSFAAYIVANVYSFSFDFAHAMANAVLLLVFGDTAVKGFRRVGKKYGVVK